MLIIRLLEYVSDDYMSAAIAKIANYMRLSESLAGATLLAFSNGASDVITAVIAPEGNNDNRIIGSLFGASIFTMTVCMSVIILMSKKKAVFNLQLVPIPAMFTTYLLTIAFLLLMASQQLYYKYLCFILIFIYVAYIIFLEYQENKVKNRSIAVLSIKLERLQTKEVPLSEDEEFQRESIVKEISEIRKKPRKKSGSFKDDIMAQSIVNLPADAPPYEVLMAKVKVQVHGTWSERNIFLKVLYVLEAPLHFIIRATIPPVDEPMFFRFQQYAYPFTSVFFCLFAKKQLTNSFSLFSKDIPVPLAGLLVSGIILLITILKSEHVYKPTPRWLFLLLTGVTSIVWMDFMVGIINDIVDFVQVWTGASDPYLGMTFFGIGNSIVDFFVDVTLARKGYQIMAITGIFGGQMFNLLIGFGLSAMIRGFKDTNLRFHLFNWNEVFTSKEPTLVIILMGTCFMVLVGYWIAKLVLRDSFNKAIGYGSMALYLLFLLTASAIEVFWR